MIFYRPKKKKEDDDASSSVKGTAKLFLPAPIDDNPSVLKLVGLLHQHVLVKKHKLCFIENTNLSRRSWRNEMHDCFGDMIAF